MSISEFSFEKASAIVTGWITMVCDANHTVWNSLELLDAKIGGIEISGQDYMELEKPSTLGPAFKYWSTMKLRADVSVVFDLRYYPFDKIYVPLSLESLYDTQTLRVLYDAKETSVAPDFATDSSVELAPGVPRAVVDVASYSDAYLTQNASEIPMFDRVTIVYQFSRDDTTNFVQNMLPTYISFLLSTASLILPISDHFDARMGIMGASIFVVVLNVGALNTFLGYPTVMTTGDIINVVTMIIVGLIFIESIVEKWLLIRHQRKEAKEEAAQAALLAEEEKEMMVEEEPDEAAKLAADVAAAIGSTAVEGTFTSTTKRRVAQLGPAPVAPELPKEEPKRRLFGLLSPEGESSYSDNLVKMSLTTFAFAWIVYIAINIGMMVGYRPPACYPGLQC